MDTIKRDKTIEPDKVRNVKAGQLFVLKDSDPADDVYLLIEKNGIYPTIINLTQSFTGNEEIEFVEFVAVSDNGCLEWEII